MKCTKKYFILWGSATCGMMMSLASAQTVHISHCFGACPSGAPAANEIVVRHLFAASINYHTGLADWVAYRVLRGSVGVASLLPRNWQPDQLLDSQLEENISSRPRFSQPDLSNQQDRDYRLSEIVINPEGRGRLAPMSAFAGTPFWEELNYLSNMAPIPSALRNGPWARLDQAVNELAHKTGEVHVVSGPLFQLNESDVSLVSNRPVAYFKFITTQNDFASFVFPQDLSQHSGYCDHLSSLTRLQQLSGLHIRDQGEQLGSEDLQFQLGCSDNPTN